MNKAEIKNRLIEECRHKLLETITNLEIVMADAQQQANDYGQPKDRYDSFRAQLMRRRDMMAQQMSKEMQELKVLGQIDLKKEYAAVGFGAIVLTNDQNYFISIGQGKIELDGETFYTISPMVPMSQAMTGRKKGESFNFREKKIEIRDVY